MTWWRRFDNNTVIQVESDRHVVVCEEALIFTPVMKDDEDGIYYCNISSPLETLISNDAMLRVYGEL